LHFLQLRRSVLNWRRNVVPPKYAAPHKRCGSCRRETEVKTFENAASLMLAIAAQALAVGVILAL